MLRHFLFTFRLVARPDVTYQCLLDTEAGLPDLVTFCQIVEHKLGRESGEVQYLCHSEFTDRKEIVQFLGSLLSGADVYQVHKNGILKLKHSGVESDEYIN